MNVFAYFLPIPTCRHAYQRGKESLFWFFLFAATVPTPTLSVPVERRSSPFAARTYFIIWGLGMNFHPVFHHLQRKRTIFTRATQVGSGGRVVGHFFPLVFASLGEFVLLDFGSFWKIRSKRLLHGRQSAAQAEQLPGRQSVHFFFSLNEFLYRWNFKSPAIYIMEHFFYIYIPHRHCAFWAKTAPNRLLIFHVAQIKFFLYPLAGSCWSPPPVSKAYASFFDWKLPSSL